MKYYILFAIASLFILSTCNKKDEKKMALSGDIKDYYQNNSISGVFIELYAKKIESGVWSNTYSLIGSTSSDANGNFNFSFDNILSSGYKLTFHKTKYFDSEILINPENIEAGKDYKQNYYLYSEAYLKIQIKNQTPSYTQDQLSYSIVSGSAQGSGCCWDSTYTYVGNNVNILKKCKVYGGNWIKFNWYVTSLGNTQLFKDSIKSIPNDTVQFNINY